MEPSTLYIDKTEHGHYFIGYLDQEGKTEYLFKKSYEKSWNTLIGAKLKAKELAQQLNYQTIVVKKK